MRWRTALQIGVVLALAFGIAGYAVYNEYHNTQYDEFLARAFEECRRGYGGAALKNIRLAQEHLTSTEREEAWKESAIKIRRNQCE